MQKARRFLKDAVLIALILLSLFLVCRIWFGTFISPERYREAVSRVKSFFASPVTMLLKNRSNPFSYNIKILLKPEKVVVNYAAKRAELSAGDDDFEAIKEVSEEFLKQMLLGDAKILEKSSAAFEEYFAALKGKSLFVSYGNKMDSRLVSMSICGESGSKITGDVSEIKDILIAFNDNVLNNVFVYISDSKTGNIIKYSVEYNKAKLDNIVNDFFASKQHASIPSYSFELNFHKSAEGSAAKVLFAPTILLEVTPKQSSSIRAETISDFSDEYGVSGEIESAVLRSFKINPLTMRKFTDVSGSAVFVENYGTLMVNPKGSIEFKAADGRNGIKLYDGVGEQTNDIYKTTTFAVDFISNVCAAFPEKLMDNLQINCDLTAEQSKSGRYVLKFDYFIDGAPVFIKTDSGMESAIELIIENGNLVFYRQHLKKYYKTDETHSAVTSINAADKIVENYPENELPVYINRMGGCFVDNGENGFERMWRFEIDGKADAVFVK